MAKQALIDSHKANVPLAEVTLVLTDGIDLDEIIRELNELADDFEVSPHWMNAMSGENNALTADATREALRRLFGWEIKRVNLERWNSETKELSHWNNTFRWEEVNQPKKFPSCLEGKVKEIGLTQPGRLDNGQP